MKVARSPQTALFPCPVVLVTCIDAKGKPNIITLAWAGVACSNPPIISIGIRPDRYSYNLIKQSEEFAVNIPTEEYVKDTDFCGLFSGKAVDKFAETKLTPDPAEQIKPPIIRECPVNIECIVKSLIPLGSHHLFLGEVVNVLVDESILDEKGRIDLVKAAPFTFNSGEYWSLKKKIGDIGLSKRSR
ncbi:MAG: flavin reductase family protein [Candidatus Bathyarchaeota archaeon]|nr:MAG: flavin reductase family protein [Candidatus Bathyarchaeota archaeon]